MIAADAVEKALQCGKSQDFQSAQKFILEAQSRIRASPTSLDPYCLGLVQQLDQCRNEVKDRELWLKKGQGNLTTVYNSHSQQRGTHRSSMYSTTYKTYMRSSYHSLNKQ
eukprot:TRINITY_DN5863_c0_g1_i1.p1 TRINITY_DN5863_c0_g1~~TRINITY_DN5863_c0_g1_i1.p1  ORF type:complete len:110 (-),score=9.14 TRINITY_DN5863_c0_g1_i1:33-362(-)